MIPLILHLRTKYAISLRVLCLQYLAAWRQSSDAFVNQLGL